MIRDNDVRPHEVEARSPTVASLNADRSVSSILKMVHMTPSSQKFWRRRAQHPPLDLGWNCESSELNGAFQTGSARAAVELFAVPWVFVRYRLPGPVPIGGHRFQGRESETGAATMPA